MGRNIACGIPVRIIVTKGNVFSKSNEKIDKKDIPLIKKEISNYLDLKHYNIDVYEDGICFFINFDFFNDNIHTTLKELNELSECEYFVYKYKYDNYKDGDINDVILCQKKYPMKLDSKEDEYSHTYIILKTAEDDGVKEMPTLYGENWIFENEHINNNYSIRLHFINLWMDINDFDSDGEFTLLRIMNKMKREFFRKCNELTKNIIYYVAY